MSNNKMTLTGNDAIGQGEIRIYWSDSGKAVSPFGIEFSRPDGGKIINRCSFNIPRSEAKKMALFILEQL